MTPLILSIRPSAIHFDCLPGEGRDEDVVDAVVLDGVADGGEGLGAHRLAGPVDLLAVERGEGGGEAVADLLAGNVSGGGRDEGVAMGALAVAGDQAIDEVGCVDRLRGDDERVGDVPAHGVVLDPDGDVLDRHREARAGDLDQVLAGEAVTGLGEGGDQHLGGAVGADRVIEGEGGIGVEDRGGGLDAEGVEDVLGDLDPAQRRVADLVDVDDLPGYRLVLRRGERDVLGARRRPAGGSPRAACGRPRPRSGRRGPSRRRWTRRSCAAAPAAAAACAAGDRGLRAADVGALTTHDRVARSGDAELVGTADDARDLVEVVDRGRR